jgi:hypothetical protein
MNSRILGLRVAGTIFGLGCLGQFLRLVAGVEVLVAGHQVPLWPSAIAAAIAGGMSLWLWRLSKPATT